IPVYRRILSPRIFTKLTGDVLAPLWEKGVRTQDLNCSSINCLKLLEVLCAPHWDVLVRTDNIAMVAYGSCSRYTLTTTPQVVQLIWSRFDESSDRSICFPGILPLLALLPGHAGTQLAPGFL
ncbi:hypothetical protein M9458_008783, partial [Cirrhinus mrigala]